ncbi:GAF domain-containing protein [Nocardia camponoti]|uniref:Rv3651-like N-terminal domain-containing protein n=1 Tax=Nocardia camponoti TaxID=1616106 RepID=A0A917QG53_9NOCA|nr:GAF domain-containing protein [Nocardia camponoti]GGK49108.1 hypothetical protein GCM10011591_20630 [Nocardia camponoti]
MPAREWMLVETLVEDLAPTLVATGADPKEWLPVSRWRREFGPRTCAALVDAVQRCRRTGEQVRIETDKALVLAVPVICAFGDVHGVEVWCGTDDVVPPRRQVAAWDWQANSELAYHGPGLEELVFAREPELVEVVRTPPDAFGRMVRFDGRVEYLAVATRLVDGARWQGEVDMRGDDDVVRHFQMVTRAVPAQQRVTALMHAIPERTQPDPLPDPDIVMLRAVSQTSGVGVGLVELSSALIYEWAGEPPPPLDRWAVERPWVDPDDLAELRAACAELVDRPGAVHRLALRVRFGAGDVMVAEAELAATTSGHGLLRVWSSQAG